MQYLCLHLGTLSLRMALCVGKGGENITKNTQLHVLVASVKSDMSFLIEVGSVKMLTLTSSGSCLLLHRVQEAVANEPCASTSLPGLMPATEGSKEKESSMT